MGKTRSSRRMRNCKSRNRRGGGLFGDGSCTNCSPIKREFKRYYYKEGHKLCPYVGRLSGAEINALYRELTDKKGQAERRVLINCIFVNHIKGFVIPTDIESTISSAVNELIDRRSQRLNSLSQNPHLNQSTVIPSTGSKYPSRQDDVEGVILEDPSTSDDDDDDVDEVDDNDRVGLLPKQIPHTPTTPTTISSGGKSRRRHRRGRTLHKRRKSSKVRKTRRTHSRTRR